MTKEPLSVNASYKKALKSLRKEVAQLKFGAAHDNAGNELSIVKVRKTRKKFGILTWRRFAVFLAIFLVYVFLVVFVVNYQAQNEGITSRSDPRFIAIGLTRMLDWLFVPGPQATKVMVNGTETYVLSSAEILNWLATVGISLLGWGSIISVPTLLVDSFVTRAGEQDEEIREHSLQEQEKMAEARLHGRLEITLPSFSAVFTHTADPVASVLIDSLEFSTKPSWVVIQSGDMLNTVDNLVDHVYLPDLANGSDYDQLLHAERMRGKTLVVLTNKPGFKFLQNPDNEDELDLRNSDVVQLVENVQERTKNKIQLIFCGSAEAKSGSRPYRGDSKNEATTLAQIASEMSAILVDPDEIVIREMFHHSGGVTHGDRSEIGKPIYVEFTGLSERIVILKKRLEEVIHRLKHKYPFEIVADPQDALGGVFFIGDDVEGVALTKEKLGLIQKKQPRYIVFERIDRIDEVEDIGFTPICVDYEVTKELIQILTKKKK